MEIGAGDWRVYADCNTRSDVSEVAAEKEWECPDCDDAVSERTNI